MGKHATPAAMRDAARADAAESDFGIVRRLTDAGVIVTAITPRAVVFEVNNIEVVLTRPLAMEGNHAG